MLALLVPWGNPAKLPTLPLTFTAEEQGHLTAARSLLTLTAWGQERADVTFETLGIPTQISHTLLGDELWKGYWGERQHSIEQHQWVPRQMLALLADAVEKAAVASGLTATDSASALAAERLARDSHLAPPRDYTGYFSY